MKTRLVITSLRTVAAPISTAQINVLYTTVRDGRAVFVPLKADRCGSFGLTVLTRGSNSVQDRRIRSKSTSYVMGNTVGELFFQVRLSKGGAGFNNISRFIYLSSSLRDEHGSVAFKVYDHTVPIIEGPLRLMDSAEAQERLGTNYKQSAEFNQRIDGPTLGVKLSGMTKTKPVVAKTTIGEYGETVTVNVRRTPRKIG